MVEGACLESDFAEQHQVTSNHLVANRFNELPPLDAR